MNFNQKMEKLGFQKSDLTLFRIIKRKDVFYKKGVFIPKIVKIGNFDSKLFQ